MTGNASRAFKLVAFNKTAFSVETGCYNVTNIELRNFLKTAKKNELTCVLSGSEAIT
jgi:hypothetical protein